MKRILYTSILNLLLLSAFGQSTYNKVIYYFGDSLNSSASIEGVAKLDSNYIMAVYGNANNINHGLHILKTDLYGNLVMAKQFLSDSLAYSLYSGNVILIDDDTNIVVCSNQVDSLWNGFVVKLDRNLDTIWTRRYELPLHITGCKGDQVFLAMKQCLDGNYIIASRYYLNCNKLPENSRSHLVKIDKQGNVLWYKKYQYSAHIYDVRPTPDSGFVFTDFFPIGFVYTLSKTDSMGDVIWEEQIDDEEHFVSGAVAIDSNNDIVTFAPYIYKQSSSQTFRYALHILKYDLQGNKIWDRKYNTFLSLQCHSLHKNFELEILPNNNILVMGTVALKNPFDTMQYGYQGFTMMLNANGDSLWARYYEVREFTDAGQFNDIVPGIDGGYLAVGYLRAYCSGCNLGAWLVKMDSMGYAPGSQTVGIQKPKADMLTLNVYPNPASDILTLDLSEAIKLEAELMIYNALGQKVYAYRITQGKQKHNMDIRNWENGIYFIELYQDNMVLGRSKFIVRNP